MLKSSVFIGLAAAYCLYPAEAQVFMTGQAARAVLGQRTFTTQTYGSTAPSANQPGVPSSFGAVGGLAYFGNTLFATDANRVGLQPNNFRTILFGNINQQVSGALSVPSATANIPAASGRCPVCVGTVTVELGDRDANGAPVSATTQTGMRVPTGVASDGNILAVVDAGNNRVMIWKSVPATSATPADIVLGQPDFTSSVAQSLSAHSLRNPQGVWIQNGKLFVADTGNSRVLIWNSIPTRNNQDADIVIGQPNFTTVSVPNIVSGFGNNPPATASPSLLWDPTSVTSDGQRLYVADLGYNRVLIWNSIPASNQVPADVEIGQVDMTQAIANDASHLCASNGTDSNGNLTYPARCGATLNFPRFAISDGNRLFIADTGNNRVLVFNQVPTQNGAKADAVLGQPDEFSDVVTNPQGIVFSSNPSNLSASNITPVPTSLAWDALNQNLYVADPTNFRILVFSPGMPAVPLNGAVNFASQEIFALGTVVIGGTITENNTVTVTINGTDYKYTITANDTLDSVAKALTNAINSANGGQGDPNVNASFQSGLATILLVAKVSGDNGNNITLATSVSTNATITATASGSTLTGGNNAANLSPGAFITINANPGATLSDVSAAADQTQVGAPFQLPVNSSGAKTQVYVDGDALPLFYVSPTSINAQIPWEVVNSTSLSLWVRTTHQDGSVTVTNPIGIPVQPGAPGIFAYAGSEPRAAMAYHASSFATAAINVTGTIQAGDVATINIDDRTYSYTVKSTDTLTDVVNNLVDTINSNPEEIMTASPLGVGTGVLLTAKVPGPDGNGIPITVAQSTASTNTGGALIVLTAISSVSCCANVAGAPVTPANPAVGGESIFVYATGLGVIQSVPPQQPDPAQQALAGSTGFKYQGPAVNAPMTNVIANVQGGTATVLSSALLPNTFGVYKVVIQLPGNLTQNAFAQLYLQQNFSRSNITTIPIGPPSVLTQ